MTIASMCMALTGIMVFVYTVGFNRYDNRLTVCCPDTVKIPVVAVNDSVSDDLCEMKLHIERLRQDSVRVHSLLEKSIDDYRQETNNVINKVNGWLSLWIAASSILVTLLPILFQFHIGRDNQKAVEKRIAESERGLRRMRDELKHQMDEVRSQITISRSLAQFRSGVESRMIQNISGKTMLGMVLWDEALDNFELVTSDLLTQKNVLGRSELQLIQRMLLQLWGFIDKFKTDMNVVRARYVDDAGDSIINLFNWLEVGSERSKEAVKGRVEKLLVDLRTLSQKIQA